MTDVRTDIINNLSQAMTKSKDRIQCLVNHKGIETYCFDNIPVIEIYPLQYDVEGNIMTAKQNYRVLLEDV